jgi:AraC family transcriptional regulator, regulatory protein of adaptative response / DNA-3-methyladenine glycosylase II
MELTPAICYRALSSRDARFDGRFFTGVVTTGVYCRPVCPARAPHRANVRFFPTAAAAEAAGFRPCLRCRPEASPGTPAWAGTSATVTRALRHIEAGALDQGNITDLATRLGVGERHLRRLFLTHLGAAPHVVALTRRVQIAKKLLDETTLPMARIALDAGFPSVRRFNAAMRRTYGRNPSELRRARPQGAAAPGRRLNGAASGEPGVTLHLSFRPPLDWRRLTAYLGPRAIPGVEAIENGAYRRALVFGDAAGVVEVRPVAGRAMLRLSVPAALSPHLVPIVAGARRVFDLGADPREIVGHLRRDAALAALLRGRRDVRVPGAWSGFEVATRAILGQQISVSAATTLAGRIAKSLGPALPAPCGTITHGFPEPERLAGASLARIGLTRARAATLIELARRVAGGELALAVSPGLEASLAALQALPGVGPWTAHYVAMRALAEPDAFPAGDLGLRKALDEGEGPPSQAALERRAEPWRPWRAYAAMLIWTSNPGA